jgi:hypothetical protein
MSVRYTLGEAAVDGGLDVTISLNPAEARVLGEDALELGDWFNTVLETLLLLRTGAFPSRPPRRPTEEDWEVAIHETLCQLMPRLQGISDATVRTAHGHGLSHADIALSMDVPRSTAQSRIRKITSQPTAATFEDWALTDHPTMKKRIAAAARA